MKSKEEGAQSKFCLLSPKLTFWEEVGFMGNKRLELKGEGGGIKRSIWETGFVSQM